MTRKKTQAAIRLP